ncbi:MAG: indole acetimide hydrolase [Actinobacteria bacterium]|nr:indole acetimide hydrolase [Actinomycetota bacterium]
MALAVAAGEISAEEVTTAHIARIERLNPALNAVVEVRHQALEDARAIDAARMNGEHIGEFAGVPISVKAEIDVAGSATTSGVVSLRDRVPTVDAPTVERLRRAGAVVIARTNMPDLGMRLHTDSGLYGATINPWDSKVTPGGSSGGDAVAVATGMVCLGVGSDIGGSLRNPATCCGIASLKPGLGTIPVAYEGVTRIPPSEQLMCVQGPLARRVEDLEAAFAILEGPHERDPWSLIPSPVATAAKGTNRVAVTACPPGGSVDPRVAEAVSSSARALEVAGYEVEEVDPPMIEELFEVWRALMANGEFLADQPELTLGDGVSRFLALTMTEADGDSNRGALAEALADRHHLALSWIEFLSRYPLVLGPVWTSLPWEVGFDISGTGQAHEVLRRARLTLAANALGIPSVVVPAALADGLPVGVQIIGGPGSEKRCLAAARYVEDACGTFTPIEGPVGA